MKNFLIGIIVFFSCFPTLLQAQTDIDAIMMEKKQLCIGPMYNYSSFKNYWEGTTKRDNANLGTVSTKMYSVMASYGITSTVNFLFNIPYVQTNASAGTMHGMKGMQDLNLYLKWMPVEKQIGAGTFSLYTIAGGSLPVTNYVADYLPLAIGLHSKTATARIMADYQINHLFFTGSATYMVKNKVKIDRTAYYDTELHLTNEVAIPDETSFNFRVGYRSSKLLAEGLINRSVTRGGFDITKNNMPFPSNRMNATTVGVNFKYGVSQNNKLSIVTGGNTTIAGRNVGQSTNYYGSIFYILDFTHHTKSTNNSGKTP